MNGNRLSWPLEPLLCEKTSKTSFGLFVNYRPTSITDWSWMKEKCVLQVFFMARRREVISREEILWKQNKHARNTRKHSYMDWRKRAHYLQIRMSAEFFDPFMVKYWKADDWESLTFYETLLSSINDYVIQQGWWD